jgi:hypothetical protein
MGRSIADLAQHNRHIPEAKCSDMDVGYRERVAHRSLSEQSGKNILAAPALWPVASFSKRMEVVMTHESRLLAGILLIVLPSVMVGGVSILSLLIGDPAYMQNPCARICGGQDTHTLASGSSWHSWRCATLTKPTSPIS